MSWHHATDSEIADSLRAWAHAHGRPPTAGDWRREGSTAHPLCVWCVVVLAARGMVPWPRPVRAEAALAETLLAGADRRSVGRGREAARPCADAP